MMAAELEPITSISRYVIFLTYPPLDRPDLIRIPVPQFLKVELLTCTLLTPPLISEPMQTPADVGDTTVRLWITMFVDGTPTATP